MTKHQRKTFKAQHRFDRWFEAALDGDVDHLKRELKAGMDVDNCQCPTSQTALCHAVENGHRDAVELLLKAGAKPWGPPISNQVDLLRHAAAMGNIEIAKLLIDAGLSADYQIEDELMPLHLAAMLGQVEMTSFLISCGASLDRIGYMEPIFKLLGKGCTPLSLAVARGQSPVVRVLIESGADPSVEISKGHTIIEEAAEMGKSVMVLHLLELGVPNPFSMTAVHDSGLASVRHGAVPHLSFHMPDEVRQALRFYDFCGELERALSPTVATACTAASRRL